MLFFLLKGLVLGFSIAAPVGPIGLLCIRRTLADGRIVGFVSGLGAATADATYGFIAAFGLTLVSGFLLHYAAIIRTVGVLFLFYIAIRIFFAKPSQKTIENTHHVSLFHYYISTVFLTITNPLTIISFLAVFAGVGIGSTVHNYTGAAFTVLGVFLGSALWWFILTTFVGLFKSHISTNGMIWVNRLSALLMITLGIVSFIR